MLQFIAKVEFYDGEIGENKTVNLLCGAESFEEAMRNIEGYYAEDLMSVSLKCMTNKLWIQIDDYMADTIPTYSENQEFW